MFINKLSVHIWQDHLLGIGLPVKLHKTPAGHIPITHPEMCRLSVVIPRIKCGLISSNVNKAVCV